MNGVNVDCGQFVNGTKFCGQFKNGVNIWSGSGMEVNDIKNICDNTQ